MPEGLPKPGAKKFFLLYFCSRAGAEGVCAETMKSAGRHVPDRSQPYKSTSFELLYIPEGLPKPGAKKKFWTVFLLARGRGSSAESHLPPNFELHCAGSGPHQSTSFELLCPSEAFPKRAVANSFLVSTCIFDSARQSVQNQRCLQSRGLSTAEVYMD